MGAMLQLESAFSTRAGSWDGWDHPSGLAGRVDSWPQNSAATVGRGLTGVFPISVIGVSREESWAGHGSYQHQMRQRPSTAKFMAGTNRWFFNCLNGNCKNTSQIWPNRGKNSSNSWKFHAIKTLKTLKERNVLVDQAYQSIPCSTNRSLESGTQMPTNSIRLTRNKLPLPPNLVSLTVSSF